MNRFIKKIAVAMVSTTILCSSASYGGMMVFDAVVNGNVVQSISALREQISQLKNQLGELQKMNSNLTGNSGVGTSILPGITDLKRAVTDLTPSVYQLNMPEGTSYNPKNTQDVTRMIDSVFTPQDIMMKNGDDQKNIRSDYRQKTLKSALELSEGLLNRSQDGFDRILANANAINSTKNAAEKQDLGNKLLNDILMVQQEMLILIAQLTRAEVAAKYVGVKSDNVAKKNTTLRKELESVLGPIDDAPQLNLPTSGTPKYMWR